LLEPIKRHPLLSFFLLAFGLSWLGAIPFALGVWPVPIFPFGPLLAALIVSGATGTTRSLLRRMIQWRASPKWYAFALIPPVAITLSAAYLNMLLGAPDPTSAIVAALPMVVPYFALMMVYPLQGTMGEEPGWRGIALPRMLAGRSPLLVSLVLGAIWASWHLPLFITGQYGDPWLRIAFIVSTSVLYTLLVQATGGSVLMAMVHHTAWNLAPEILLASFVGPDLQRALTLYMVGGIAMGVVVTIVAYAGELTARALVVTHPLLPAESGQASH
jgi:membrane protease YdiL (CAAX protease family)